MSHDNGFNTIRLLAASAVLFSHAFVLTSGRATADPLFQLTGEQASLGHLAVAIFFILSGEMIAGSVDRSGIHSFWIRRAARLLPGLWISVLLTILVIGPLFTAASLAGYFSSSTTLTYLRHAVFIPADYRLESVFDDRPLSGAVNGSLWTLKYEVACYFICFVTLHLRPIRRAVVPALWIASFAASAVFPPPESLDGLAFHMMSLADLFRFFGAGMLIYLWKDRIPFRTDLAWLALGLTIASIWTPLFVEAVATLGAYSIFHFGNHAPRWFRNITQRGDISYGVYIYAFPVQQALVPLCIGLPAAWLANTVLALPVTLVLAMASWTLVEAPAMERGRRLARQARLATI